MSINCRNCPLRTLQVFRSMSADEVKFMQEFKRGELSVDAGSTILMEGSNSPQLFTALKGVGLRYKNMPDGQRQVVNFVLPGDFVGLQAGLMGEMQHSVEATTQMTLCVFSRNELWDIFRHQPERAFDLTWLAALEEHFLGETLAVVGRKNGEQRIAWGLLKYYCRMDALGLANNGQVQFPYRQQDLADALGLSLVHTNKTLKRLRERQVVRWDSGILRVSNLRLLAECADVDDYSVMERPLI
ncbi:Crp/Fnr family transcriptional regulator [Algicella marina]|uniref:Cyclic nucleotide-binding domain-containing protein n=1 Tax=Algicella marina TaxID=2683284 RepID=A0A6P1SZU5_9RHOB|nr:Crp/Fnr family transcriptional regulator [Algicella marina]QHQ35045.1 cyclic nucleotide-binding domain-containing protein [Algicella marina]